MHTKYYIGFDLGSSSVKVALVNAASGKNILSLHEPKHEMSILSKQSDWAEQDPNNWWKFVCQGTKRILQESKIDSSISQFELESAVSIPAKFLSGGQKKKLVIALSLLSDPKAVSYTHLTLPTNREV